MYLERNGEVVAKAVDDGNGGDDNLSLSLHYKEKVPRNGNLYKSEYCVKAEVKKDHVILSKQLQIGYRFYSTSHHLGFHDLEFHD